MRRIAVVLLCVVPLLLAATPQAAPDAAPSSARLLGFSDQNAQTERGWEQKFRALPSTDLQKQYSQRLSARPHHVGSPYDKDNAEWLLNLVRSWGLDAQIENFDVLMPTPKERLVEMTEPTRFTLKLQEPPVAVDPTSNQQAEQLPTYNAYSIDGDVTGPLVYVNYGVPDDYDELARMGVDVKGAIVIARYGESWRGIKPKVAAEHGAVGCLIFSDPKDDGYAQGDVFPQGPFRPKDGVQRGSVMDMPINPGDPLTPGVGAVPGAKRLDLKEVKTLTKIPVLPISYADAQPLLAAMRGPVVPERWRGGLPITYRAGAGPAKVHMRVMANWNTARLYDVIVRIPGSQFPDEWVIRGNHHDAWVNGAQDPISGAVAELEELRAFSELVKQGWKPKRTIIYALWDGEEEGLLGSTEWTEQHADELRQKAVAYINSDVNARGYFNVEGSHSLEKFVNGVSKDITDPEKNTSVWQRAKLWAISRATKDEDRNELRTRADLRIPALGSGSDYTAFLDHLGVASFNFGYGGEDQGGIYHSIYDDFYWFAHFSDGDFKYGRALAQTAGTAVMRLANADVLPFEFTNLADTVKKYIADIKKYADDQRSHLREQQREMEEGVYSATSDPRDPRLAPKAEAVPPILNFAPLENGAEALTRAADRYHRALARAEQNGAAALASGTAAQLNRTLIQTERRLTLDEGLPNRPWFRHQLYAPGFYTGYGVKTIPAVRESVEQKQWKEAEAAAVRVGRLLEDEAALIEQAAQQLEGAK
jgi:N-acetylated-alpha-linked acidic dipeptidase